MGTYQSTFGKTPAIGVAGMRANTEEENVISRTVESAAGIAFGQPAFRGVDDHGCVVGAAFAATGAGSAAASGNIGTGVITASPAVALPAKPGRYRIILLATSATAAFAMYDPTGVLVGHGNVATAATIDGIGPFTITNAGTMTVGDTYYIDVTFGAGSLNMLGLVVMDPAVPAVAASPDKVPQYFTASIMNQGIIWVTAGGTVTDGDPVYWKQSTLRYTASSADGIRVSGAYFDTSGVDGGLVRMAIRDRIAVTV